MKTRSCKAKGRKLQQWTASKVAEVTGLKVEKDGEIESRIMGASGVDVILRGEARRLFPWSIENKNQEALNIWTAISQAKSNQMSNTEWLLICKRNREDPIAVIDAEVFFSLYKELLEFRSKNAKEHS